MSIRLISTEQLRRMEDQGHQIPPVTKLWVTVWQFLAWSTLCGELQLPYGLDAGGGGEEE